MYGTPDDIDACRIAGEISKEILTELRSLKPEWKIVPGRDYRTWFCLEHLSKTKELFPRWHNAFMLCLPPEGQLHKHSDTVEPYKTFHIPVETNYRSFNCFEVDGENVSMHMRAGKYYLFDRSVPHWAVNGGVTDRIHLLCEVFV